jgi:hypothetical protein
MAGRAESRRAAANLNLLAISWVIHPSRVRPMEVRASGKHSCSSLSVSTVWRD